MSPSELGCRKMADVRRLLSVSLVLASLALFIEPAEARAPWKKQIDRLVSGRSISVMVRDEGDVLYRWNPSAPRIPASNQKLLLSMALLERISPEKTIATTAAAEHIDIGVIAGDLYILGRGDPSITGGGRFGLELPFAPTRISKLAREVQAAGVSAVTGSVVGNTGYYSRDWDAPGWKPNFPREYIALPSALSFEGNSAGGRYIKNPEWRAARALTRRLRALGISVSGSPRSGSATSGLQPVAAVRSAPVEQMLRFMNRRSSNFFAEMYLKRLAVETYGPPGSLAAGAQAIEGWAAGRGVTVTAHDGSGLSYRNRISPDGMTQLISYAEEQPWGQVLRSTLAAAGEGTLEERLAGVRIRAKTGTLEHISTLSGWVWLRQTGSWAEFSIMSDGMLKATAAQIEDAIVRELTRRAKP